MLPSTSHVQIMWFTNRENQTYLQTKDFSKLWLSSAVPLDWLLLLVLFPIMMLWWRGLICVSLPRVPSQYAISRVVVVVATWCTGCAPVEEKKKNWSQILRILIHQHARFILLFHFKPVFVVWRGKNILSIQYMCGIITKSDVLRSSFTLEKSYQLRWGSMNLKNTKADFKISQAFSNSSLHLFPLFRR